MGVRLHLGMIPCQEYNQQHALGRCRLGATQMKQKANTICFTLGLQYHLGSFQPKGMLYIFHNHKERLGIVPGRYPILAPIHVIYPYLKKKKNVPSYPCNTVTFLVLGEGLQAFECLTPGEWMKCFSNRRIEICIYQ